MRTAPPVLDEDAPPPEYKSTFLDRHGPDGGLALHVAGYALGAFLTTFMVVSMYFGPVAGLVGGSALGFLAYHGAMKFSSAAGAGFKAFIWPSGDSTPYEHTFSYQESLVAKGQMKEALESYEAVIAEQPGSAAPRMKAAEHYARRNLNPARAAELFREIRSIPGIPGREKLYATSRLADLYQGPLSDPGRALVELRRIIEEHPTSPAARYAREALPALKARLEAARPRV